MSPADQYKKFENKVALNLTGLLKSFGRSVAALYRRFVRTGKQRFTIMLIPHSEKKIFNFKMSLFAIVFVGVLLSAVLVTFLLFATQFTGVHELLTNRSTSLASAEASLESYRDEFNELRKTASAFIAALNSTKQALGLDQGQEPQNASAQGDLSSFYDVQERDQSLIRNLNAELLTSMDFLKDIKKNVDSIKELTSSLPTAWPVEGPVRITNKFGFQVHPIEGGTYLHKGIDIAKSPNVPILAAANGRVIQKGFELNNFGNFVVMNHIAGYSTMYAHMSKVYVREGDYVVQGQVIGLMGDTGIATGYHLHFEIRLGTQVQDPMTYLRLKDSVNANSLK